MKLKHLMGVLLVLLLGSGIAKAQTEDGFRICGVEVDSENVKKLNEIEGVSVGAGGHISYSPETNTLSIKDVSMQPEGGKGCLYVYSAYKNLPFTLHLEGENQFNATGTGAIAFWTKCNTRIEGSGELFIRTKDSGIFVSNNTTLAIEDCSLEIVSETDGEGYTGISGYWNTQPKLVIKNASIYAKASGKEVGHYPYAIGGFESITLEGSVITQPSNAGIGSYTFYSGGTSYTKQFVMSGDKPATEVRIEKKAIPYEFSICGVGVNSGNVKKLNEIKGVTVGAGGHISYSPETNTLSIKNVSMQAEGGKRCLYVYSAYKNLPFTLHLEGKNQFNATDETAFWTECDTRIEGSGELFIRTNHYGIFVHHDATLAIEDCSLEIVSETDGEGYTGISGYWNTQPKLVIKNASIYAKASGKEVGHYPYAIGGFESITLEGSVITQPSNAGIGSYTFSWDGASHTKQFVMSDGKPATEVRIEKVIPYEFSICGEGVNSGNVDKLDKIKGVTVGAGGHITYSPETSTLSIKDVTLQPSEGVFAVYVDCQFDDQLFTLSLEGENQFNIPNNCLSLYTDADMRIDGSGKLSIRTKGTGIFVANDATMTIEDCTLDIVSDTNGEGRACIEANCSEQSHLMIKNASIYAKSSGKENAYYPYAIGEFESILLGGVTITEPRDGVVGSYTVQMGEDYFTKQFIMSGDKPAKEVKIMKTLAVEEVDVADLRVYPNPATHYVQVEGAKAGASIALYSLEGIRLLAAEANEAGAVELDLTTLPAGNYVVKAGGKHLKLSVKH
ncbi:T9SS type A sorting domain-containing protein [Porphyromonas endodontalis]